MARDHNCGCRICDERHEAAEAAARASTEEVQKEMVSNPQVMSSAAGHYVGRIVTGEDGFSEPYSRETDYFKSSAEAERYLEGWKRADPEEFE